MSFAPQFLHNNETRRNSSFSSARRYTRLKRAKVTSRVRVSIMDILGKILALGCTRAARNYGRGILFRPA